MMVTGTDTISSERFPCSEETRTILDELRARIPYEGVLVTCRRHRSPVTGTRAMPLQTGVAFCADELFYRWRPALTEVVATRQAMDDMMLDFVGYASPLDNPLQVRGCEWWWDSLFVDHGHEAFVIAYLEKPEPRGAREFFWNRVSRAAALGMVRYGLVVSPYLVTAEEWQAGRRQAATAARRIRSAG